MKKSQITIFIVLGIVILMIVGMVLFISRQTSEGVLEKKVNKVYADFLRSTGINQYVSSCLDKSTNEAIKLAALQGGKIYDYQIVGGYNITSSNETVPFNSTLVNPNGIIHNLSYGIRAPKVIIPYPYPGSLVESHFKKYSSNYDDPFALDSPFTLIGGYRYFLTSLCNTYGPNLANITGAIYSCETLIYLNISMQQYLKLYIINRTKTCVNFPQFAEQTKYNISEGNMTGFVLMGNDDVFVSITYPVLISLRGKPPKTRFLEFTSRPKIRLKKVHELAMHLIGYWGRLNEPIADAQNIFFNITRDDPNDCFADNELGGQSCILDGMSVNQIKDYCLNNPVCDSIQEHYKYSDIINITDGNSLIGGKPLTFLFVIENRAPVLDFINYEVKPDLFYYRYLNSTFNKNLTKVYNKVGTYFPSDIFVNEGDLIEIFPLGLDPDEDDLTYHINNTFFFKTGENNFTGNLGAGYYVVMINVSDNEGLYDYQDVIIKVV